MIYLSYKLDQDSSSLELAGMPDVSNGDSEVTIGILSSWKLKIIGLPLLEGEKEHLENFMHVIMLYSRSYISGFRKTFISNNKNVTISPLGVSHKLLLKSTKIGVKPLEVVLDDSELSDLTRCLDILRFDPRFNIRWNLSEERPFSKRYIFSSLSKNRVNLNFIYSLIVFLSFSFILILVPIDNNFEYKDTTTSPQNTSREFE